MVMTSRMSLLFTLLAAGLCADVCAQSPPVTAGSPKPIAIPVTVVSTQTALGDNDYTYPRTLSISVPPSLSGQVGAYGAAGVVWVGPKSWTGNANVGADGNTNVTLYPKGGSGESSPHINYTIFPACVGCILGAAARYFPDAQKMYDQEYNQDGKNPVDIPPGLKVAFDLPHLVRYTLANANGFLTRGAANFSGVENYTEVRIVLPENEAPLAGFLLERFEDSLIEGADERELLRRLGPPSQATSQNGVKTFYYRTSARGRIAIRIVNGKATLLEPTPVPH